MSADQFDSTLVISDGGIASLVAAVLARPAESTALWIPPDGTAGFDVGDAPIGAPNREAARVQADLLGLRGVVSDEKGRHGPVEPCQMLQAACRAAAQLSIGRVAWPIVCGAALADLSAAAELARLIERLGAVPGRFGAGWGQIELVLPVADLGPDQIAELALDQDAPVQACWWWDASDGVALDARERWGGALQRVADERGYPLPAEPAALSRARG